MPRSQVHEGDVVAALGWENAVHCTKDCWAPHFVGRFRSVWFLFRIVGACVSTLPFAVAMASSEKHRIGGEAHLELAHRKRGRSLWPDHLFPDFELLAPIMPEFLKLLPPDEARALLLAQIGTPAVAAEEIDTASALHRVTAEDVVAPHPLPEFTRSSVDGYAVRAQDTYGAGDTLPAYLRSLRSTDGRGTCVRSR
jgi:hypothetical protein